MTPDRIRYHREAMGLSQEALAALLGVSRGAVLRWELPADNREHRNPPPFLGLAMAAVNARLEALV